MEHIDAEQVLDLIIVQTDALPLVVHQVLLISVKQASILVNHVLKIEILNIPFSMLRLWVVVAHID